MSEKRLTAEELARKMAEARGANYERTEPGRWMRAARAAADALGVELAPEREGLEPCPACGGDDVVFVGDAVLCDRVGCEVNGPADDPAGKKWNRMCRRLSTYRPPRDLEAVHPRPWRLTPDGEIRDSDGDRVLVVGLGSGMSMNALVAAYNAAGDAEE